MAVTTKKFFPATSNATTTVFNNVGIQLNNQDDLDVYVTLSGGTRVLQLRQATGSTAQSSHPQVNNTDGLYFPAVSAGTTLYNYTLSTDNNTITFNSALPQGAVVFCERRTRDADGTYTSFASGSTIRATDLNNSSTESNFTAQDGRNKALLMEGAIFNGDEITPVYVNSANIVDGTIQTVDIGADQITNALIADSQIDSEHYVDGSIDHVHLANDIIDGDNIQDDVINSEHYVAGSIDHEHLANDIIDGDNIQDDVINSEHYVAGSIDHEHLANDIIDGDNIQDSVINSEHYVDGSIDREHLAADIVDSTKIADDAIGAEHIQVNAVTDSEIATGTLDNRYYTESELNGGSLDARYFTESELDAGQLDNRYFTETELTNGALDGRYYTETEAEALFLRQDSSETISSGDTWSASDSKVATTAAIDLRVIELVDDVGGFVPIANETSFPTTNPDINTSGSAKGGTIVSVKAASTALAPQSGTTLTIANGRGTGNAVIITGVTATIPQGFGFLVETTATDHTYAFHRLLPVATQVATVANNITNIVNAGANVADINNFADLYQISTSAPTARQDSTSLQVGDLWFDSSSNKVLMIYDGSSGDGFTAATPNASDLVNINIVAGQLTFQEDLGLITDAINTGSGNNSVNTVAGSISNVNTAATNIAKITTVADDLNEGTSEIDTVATNIANVNTVGNNISNVNTVASNNANVTTVASNNANVTAVAGKATEIGRLGTADAVADMNTLGTTAIVSDMDTLADISSNITTVAGISSNVTAVANNSSNINSAVSNASNINAAVSNASNINTVSGISSNVSTVAGISGNVTTVAGISGNVTTVANNNSNVTAVANNSSNINSAVSNASNINAAVNNASNINAAVANATNINTVSSNIGQVNSFANLYRIASSDPSTNNDEGDLYFNTTSNELRVYNGSTWQGGVTATGNLAGLGANTFTGNQTVNANIIVSGTVDGKDISALGITGTTLANGVTATTQSASDNSTKVATTAYTDTAIANLVDSSPSALNTLNELAAAMGDDANFSTTITNSIATKAPINNPTFTGTVTAGTIDGTNLTLDFGTL